MYAHCIAAVFARMRMLTATNVKHLTMAVLA